jgi:oligoribonuclease NrnB/cAMP/cGMP phosphodiesterase (DHH superfamily)
MKCFYHTDLDGKCSAAIVACAIHDEPIEFIPINYNVRFPMETIEQGELVCIVDYSLSVEEMDALQEKTQENIIWIDHHRTALERFAGHKFAGRGVAGIRDTNEAGCVLTWAYFHPEGSENYLPLPEAVILIGDRDVWRWAHGDRTRFFNSGMYSHDHDNEPTAPIWARLFSGQSVNKIRKDGAVIESYREKYFAGFRKAWMFEAVIEGYRTSCINLALCGSEAWGNDEQQKEYPVLCSFVWDGRKWNISLYSASGVDVGRIAEVYGGGGHPGAAGFSCTPEQFPEIIKMQE